jgi:Family of unknown function (DUF6459)
MTTSAPQWPGQEGMSERPEEEQLPPAGPEPTQPRPARATGNSPPARSTDPATVAGGTRPTSPPTAAGTKRAAGTDRAALTHQVPGTDPAALTDRVPGTGQVAGTNGVGRPVAVVDLLERRRRQQRLRRAAARRNRFVVVRDAAERDLWAARRRARADLPSPGAVTRDIALALLEVEAGCRSAAQLERVFSPQLWEALEHRIGRRGGPLPSGRSLISVRSQEDRPGLADTVAVVRRGELVRPVALRLDACGGRWTVTELRWWRNETDTATTPGRDGRSSE